MTLRFALWMSLSTLALGAPSLCLSAQSAAPGQAIAQPIAMGRQFQLHSQSLNEMRSYQVHRPPNYDLSNSRYPVLYVLDGAEHFQHVSATVDLLSNAGKIPPMLVVGIPNTQRYRDFSNIPAAPGTSGLLKFMVDELIPAIDRDYRTRPYRILAGWSMAGRYTLYSMVHAPEAFRGYISLAPAFEGEREFPKAVSAFLEETKDRPLNADVFIAMNGNRGSDLRRVWELSSSFQERIWVARDLRYTFQPYPDESHMSIPLRGIQDGLLKIFEGWEVEDPSPIYEQGGLAAVEKHFATLSARLGFPVPVPSESLFDLFWTLENGKRFAESQQVIKRALELYPNSAQAHYLAAQHYMKQQNTALAVETLSKLLRQYPNSSRARSMLKSLNVDANEIAAEVRPSPQDLAKYAGRYGTATFVFAIERRGDKLFGRTSEQEYELNALSATRFGYSENHVYASGGIISFRSDARGRVTGLEFEGGAQLARLR